MERDSQSSSNVADVTCGDFKIDIKVENSSDVDTHEQVPHNIVSTAKDHTNEIPDLKTCFHCGRPVLSSQLKNDQFVYHCCDETEDRLETNEYKHFNDIRQDMVILQRDEDISNSNLMLKAKIIKKSFPKVRLTERKNKLHRCNICKIEFCYELDLANHAKKEHCPTVLLNDVHKKLLCEHCNLYFATESLLKMHLISAHRSEVELNDANELLDNERDDPLPVEEMTEVNAERNSPTTQPVKVPRYLFKSDVKMIKEKISNAQAIVNGKKFYQCKICNKLVCSRKALIGHDRIHTGEKPYTCHVCGKQFRLLSQVSRHINGVHERIRKYPCGICGRKFANTAALRDHTTIHTGEKPYTCHVCGKQFRLLSQVTRHIKDVHERFRKYHCDICGRKFANRGTLRDHTTIHTGERSILCQLCGKSFKTKASLYLHSKFHGEGYPYPCLHCEKAFRTKAHLTEHIHRHTGERPHECKHCGKSFYASNNLKSHVLIHTNNQTYKCSECGKDFAQIRYLKNHERNHRKKAMKQIDSGDILISDSSDSN